MEKLRESLVEGYTSMLHGFPAPSSASDQYEFPTQIYFYITTMVQNASLTFSAAMCKQMIDLYVDLSKIYMVVHDRC